MPIDKDKSITAPDIASHLIGYESAEGVKAFAHISREGIQPIADGFIQVKHGLTV